MTIFLSYLNIVKVEGRARENLYDSLQKSGWNPLGSGDSNPVFAKAGITHNV